MNLFSLFMGSETLEKPLVSDNLAIPETQKLAGGDLQFSAKIARHVTPNAPGLLTDFAGLAESEPWALLRYAKRFGPLGLCGKHSLPVLHAARPCWPKRVDQNMFAESLVGWRRYARRVSAILAIAAAQRRGERGDVGNWRRIYGAVADAIPDSDEAQAGFLALAVNALLESAQPRLIIWPNKNNRLQIAFAGIPLIAAVQLLSDPDPSATADEVQWLPSAGNLLAAIALQTAMAVAGHAGLARCANCGDIYRPARALPLNKLHFCAKCGRRASRKLYMRRVRDPEQQKEYQAIRKNQPGREER
jgi:predicted RNA-binding Zn-ribbon protein involved in translation (DUF1610 family)